MQPLISGSSNEEWVALANVTPGNTTTVTNVDGLPLQVKTDLDSSTRATEFEEVFAPKGYISLPWHGVFTVSENGVLTRWDLTMNAKASGDCTLIDYESGAIGIEVIRQ